MIKKLLFLLILISISLYFIYSNNNYTHLEYKVGRAPNYANQNDWLHLPQNQNTHDVNVFWVYPTIINSEYDNYLLDIDDKEPRKKAYGTLLKQASVFNDYANIYAPMYRQMNMTVLPYINDPKNKDAKKIQSYGQKEIKEAFDYFIKNYNNNKPFILAGHSQGSIVLIDFLKKNLGKDKNLDNMIAAYTIGYSVTPEDIKQNKNIRICSNETQTHCLITYNSMQDGMQNKAPTYIKGTYAVNPLTWTTDNIYGDFGLNKGAVFFDKNGHNPKTYPNFASAQIVEGGALAVTFKDEKLAETTLSKSETFPTGVYHVDDYALFYTNIKENIKTRIESFKTKNSI